MHITYFCQSHFSFLLPLTSSFQNTLALLSNHTKRKYPVFSSRYFLSLYFFHFVIRTSVVVRTSLSLKFVDVTIYIKALWLSLVAFSCMHWSVPPFLIYFSSLFLLNPLIVSNYTVILYTIHRSIPSLS